MAAPPTSGPRLTRRRRTADPLYFDPGIVPAGLSYEWKREDTRGKQDLAHQIALRENHFTAVPAERHPELAIGDDPLIRRGDMLLMQRPEYLTAEAQMEDIHEALRPIQQKEALIYGAPEGTFTRDHPSVHRLKGINQQWAPGENIVDGRLVSEP